jgi:hypothetical protein
MRKRQALLIPRLIFEFVCGQGNRQEECTESPFIKQNPPLLRRVYIFFFRVAQELLLPADKSNTPFHLRPQARDVQALRAGMSFERSHHLGTQDR